jgi:hypothetical protein
VIRFIRSVPAWCRIPRSARKPVYSLELPTPADRVAVEARTNPREPLSDVRQTYQFGWSVIALG